MTDNGTNGAGASHLDFLRARHAALTKDRTLDLEVPGYAHRLVIRYGRVPWSVVGRAQELFANPGPDHEGTLLAQVDFLVAACREVLVRDDDGTLKSIDPSGEPRRFDPTLAELLRFDTKTAREVVRELFRNDPAVAVQAGEVMSWSVNAEEDAAEEFMGESGPVVK